MDYDEEIEKNIPQIVDKTNEMIEYCISKNMPPKIVVKIMFSVLFSMVESSFPDKKEGKSILIDMFEVCMETYLRGVL
jgi:hypothetical protein